MEAFKIDTSEPNEFTEKDTLNTRRNPIWFPNKAPQQFDSNHILLMRGKKISVETT